MSDQILETIELLASEVIANAVLYTDAPCDVAVTRTDERLRIEVTDADPSLPSALDVGPNDENGRGLLLVDVLADAWGTQPASPGKTIWFEITPEPSTDGERDSADAPPSPHTGADVARRAEHQARFASSANSRTSFVPPTAGKQHQAA